MFAAVRASACCGRAPMTPSSETMLDTRFFEQEPFCDRFVFVEREGAWEFDRHGWDQPKGGRGRAG